MKKTLVFRGAATALATPFDKNGIDYLAFAKMIDHQLVNGIDALVVCGTTGESSTLSEAEKKELISFAVNQVRHRVPVIAGTGCNDTKRACVMSEYAAAAGADALLVVTPYYNKCTQKGLVDYYNEIAKCSNLPFIAYSVPARTGMKIEPETALKIAENELAVGIKDAGDSISDTAKTISLCGDSLPLYSGNDDRILPVLSLGGKGVISVMSNLIPSKVKKLCTMFFDGETEKSASLQTELIPLCDFLRCEVNPIPLKAALSEIGLCKNILRAPLSEISKENADKVLEIIKNL
ncbi:MAG: 4-hydroxy-tetrahydrodipicolinate synthase [Clostridia bacterium]|nr:4-hydroxy-tetrahydrodipicolinate synthase [Clostridia bacterium]